MYYLLKALSKLKPNGTFLNMVKAKGQVPDQMLYFMKKTWHISVRLEVHFIGVTNKLWLSNTYSQDLCAPFLQNTHFYIVKEEGMLAKFLRHVLRHLFLETANLLLNVTAKGQRRTFQLMLLQIGLWLDVITVHHFCLSEVVIKMPLYLFRFITGRVGCRDTFVTISLKGVCVCVCVCVPACLYLAWRDIETNLQRNQCNNI